MTTLELARRIADGVLGARNVGGVYLRNDDSTVDGPTQAVLQVLEDTESWFCRLSEDARGITVETRFPRDVQQELF